MDSRSIGRNTSEQLFETQTECPFCGKPLQRISLSVLGKTQTATVWGSCGCRRSKAYYDAIGLAGKPGSKYLASGIPAAYLDSSSECGQYADSVASGRGLYVFGAENRTGKTTLACCIAKELIDRGGSVRFETTVRIVHELQSSFDGDPSDAYSRCLNAGVLVLDDIGKEVPTPWALSVLYDVIDHRVSNGLPTVYTSNYGRGELAERFASKGDADMAKALAARIRESTDTVRFGDRTTWVEQPGLLDGGAGAR